MEAAADSEMCAHVLWDGLEHDVQVSDNWLIGIVNLSNNHLVIFQLQQHVQLVLLDKQQQAHVSISELTWTTVAAMVLCAIQPRLLVVRGVPAVLLRRCYFLVLVHLRAGVVQPQWMIVFSRFLCRFLFVCIVRQHRLHHFNPTV